MRLRTLALLALTTAPATALVLAPTPAAAKKKKGAKLKKKWNKTKHAFAGEKVGFTIHNCAERKATVCIYNAGDNAKWINKDRKELVAGKAWKTHCRNLGGKGMCKVFVTEGDMLCPVDVGNDVARVGQNQNLYVGVKKKAGETYTEANPAPLWARRGETDHCEKRP